MNYTCTLYDGLYILFEILIEIKCVSEFSFLDVVNKENNRVNVCACTCVCAVL